MILDWKIWVFFERHLVINPLCFAWKVPMHCDWMSNVWFRELTPSTEVSIRCSLDNWFTSIVVGRVSSDKVKISRVDMDTAILQGPVQIIILNSHSCVPTRDHESFAPDGNNSWLSISDLGDSRPPTLPQRFCSRRQDMPQGS